MNRTISDGKSKIPVGPVRESNPGPRAPAARIIPLDQQAIADTKITKGPEYRKRQLYSHQQLKIAVGTINAI